MQLEWSGVVSSLFFFARVNEQSTRCTPLQLRVERGRGRERRRKGGGLGCFVIHETGGKKKQQKFVLFITYMFKVLLLLF